MQTQPNTPSIVQLETNGKPDGAKSEPSLRDLQVRIASLETVIASDDKLRQLTDESEFVHLSAEELRKLLGARQVIVLRVNNAGLFQVSVVSSVAVVDRDTPFIRWIEAIVQRLVSEKLAAEEQSFQLPAFSPPDAPECKSYPFPNLLWQPLKTGPDNVFAGILAARERPWTSNDASVLRRQSDVITSIWKSLAGPDKLSRKRRHRQWLKPAIVCAVLLAGLIPVPMTTLAPVEIVAAKPQHITAPLDGVIHSIPVEPNRLVKKGDIILRFDNTDLTNALKIVERELKVAESRYDKLRQAAFSDDNAHHELAIAYNEFRLIQARREYAAAQLAKSEVRASRNGILIYANKERLVGRPAKVGERLMQIAETSEIAARIELPVADVIVLEKNSSVKLFLDANPLNALQASLETTAYHAEPNSTQQLVYRLTATLSETQPQVRIGARGTAQLSGDNVPLAYFLFRRPFASARQLLGL